MITYQRVLTKLYSKKRKLEDIPEMNFLFIESPKGVFHYPLFRTEEEAKYYDEIVNKKDPGTAHIHTYESDTNKTEFYMPEKEHDKDKYTHIKAPSEDESFNGGIIKYTEI